MFPKIKEDMSESEEKNQLIGRKLAMNKYTVTEFIGSGSFSNIFKVKDVNGNHFAAKLERMDSEFPQLCHEFRIYQILRYECNHSSIPKTYFFGEIGLYVGLIIQLLGPSLALKFNDSGKNLSPKTVTLLAIQMIDIIRYIHSRRIIYRDIKPENLLLGLPETETQNKLHIIDFGLAKEYKDVNGKHIPYRENLPLTGTARYMSINTNLGREQSRRDDMEAIGHLLIYLLKGTLPWSGLNIKDSKELFVKIAEIKQTTEPEKLCSGLPKEFCNYLKSVRSLDFTEEPNYKKFIDMFETLLKNNKEDKDEDYDWNDSKKSGNTTQKTKSKTVSNTVLNAENN